MKKISTKKINQDIPVIKRDQLGNGVRGKYFQQVEQISFGGAKMASTQQTRKTSVVVTSKEDALVIDALKRSSKEAKQIALAYNLPFIASRKKSWPVPK